MIQVLFVCAGNICRSPMADAVFAQQVRSAGLEAQISVDSAGTGAWYIGEPAHTGTLRVLRQHKIPYDGRARQFESADLQKFDYVLAMDRDTLAHIMRVMNRGEWRREQRAAHFYDDSRQPEIALFLSYAQQAGLVDLAEVPDPYYDGRFQFVYDLISVGCQALLNHIRVKHKL
jgi:protein-tyrosine phosphatase